MAMDELILVIFLFFLIFILSNSINKIYARPRINIILRGHLRDALKSNGMIHFLKEMQKHVNISVFVYTWDTIDSSASWRKINNKKYSEDPLLKLKKYITKYKFDSEETYFKNAPSYPEHSKISNSKMPTKGWRQYLYALKESAELVEPDTIRTLSMRVDFFDGCFACKNIAPNIKKLVSRIVNTSISSKVVLLGHDIGCDNMILGTATNVRWLCATMFADFDYIRNGVFDRTIHQEFILRDFLKKHDLLSKEKLT